MEEAVGPVFVGIFKFGQSRDCEISERRAFVFIYKCRIVSFPFSEGSGLLLTYPVPLFLVSYLLRCSRFPFGIEEDAMPEAPSDIDYTVGIGRHETMFRANTPRRGIPRWR